MQTCLSMVFFSLHPFSLSHNFLFIFFSHFIFPPSCLFCFFFLSFAFPNSMCRWTDRHLMTLSLSVEGQLLIQSMREGTLLYFQAVMLWPCNLVQLRKDGCCHIIPIALENTIKAIIQYDLPTISSVMGCLEFLNFAFLLKSLLNSKSVYILWFTFCLKSWKMLI